MLGCPPAQQQSPPGSLRIFPNDLHLPLLLGRGGLPKVDFFTTIIHRLVHETLPKNRACPTTHRASTTSQRLSEWITCLNCFQLLNEIGVMFQKCQN